MGCFQKVLWRQLRPLREQARSHSLVTIAYQIPVGASLLAIAIEQAQ